MSFFYQKNSFFFYLMLLLLFGSSHVSDKKLFFPESTYCECCFCFYDDTQCDTSVLSWVCP